MSMRVLTGTEIRQMLRVIPERSPFGPRDRALLILLLHTGLRVSEVCGLCVGDVVQWSAPRKMLDLPKHLGKGGKARLVPLNATARGAVSRLVQFLQARGFSVAPEAPLLTNRRGEHLPVRSLQSIIQGYREAAQLSSRITPHAFRHTMATQLVRTTGNLRVAQAVLGHARLSTVEVYTQVTPDDLERAMSTIG